MKHETWHRADQCFTQSAMCARTATDRECVCKLFGETFASHFLINRRFRLCFSVTDASAHRSRIDILLNISFIMFKFSRERGEASSETQPQKWLHLSSDNIRRHLHSLIHLLKQKVKYTSFLHLLPLNAAL